MSFDSTVNREARAAEDAATESNRARRWSNRNGINTENLTDLGFAPASDPDNLDVTTPSALGKFFRRRT